MRSIQNILIYIALSVASYAAFGQYVYEGDKFIVTFPGEPSVRTSVLEDNPLPYSIDFFIFDGQDGEHFYMLTATNYAINHFKDFSEAQIKDILHTSFFTFLESLEMELTYSEEITLNDSLGILFFGKSSGEYCQGKVYLVGNRIYKIVVLTAESNLNKNEINEFILSFKLK